MSNSTACRCRSDADRHPAIGSLPAQLGRDGPGVAEQTLEPRDIAHDGAPADPLHARRELARRRDERLGGIVLRRAGSSAGNRRFTENEGGIHVR